MQRDPVCNMEVDEKTAVTVEHGGEAFYFCSEGCRDKFLAEKQDRKSRSSYELIIIGGGPAGLTAAVYAAKLKVDTFVLLKDLGGQAIDSTKIENYMGFDFITGPELVQKFRNQLIHSNYVDHKIAEVEKVEQTPEGFRVTTSDLDSYSARALVVATGMTRRKLRVPGEEEFQRKGVFYGNIQDLSFVQGKDVVVIGGGNSAIQIVDNLHTVAAKTYLVAQSFEADPAVLKKSDGFDAADKYEGWKIERIDGDRSGLREVHIRKAAASETVTLPAAGLFIAIGLHPNSGLVSTLTQLNDRGEVVINPDCSTDIPGLFSAGDVTSAYGKRIVIASGDGARAALAAKQYVLSLRQKK